MGDGFGSGDNTQSDETTTDRGRTPGLSQATRHDREAIRRLLEDEIARNEVRDALENRKLFRHPLVVAIFGFLLTFVVGRAITAEISERAEREVLQREALAAVRDFSAIAAERTERMALLTSSLRREASSDELTARKTSYDQSYVEWNSNLQKNYLYLRENFGYTFKTFAEYAIDDSLGQIFSLYDDCLTVAYDGVVSGQMQDGGAALEACLARRGVERSGRQSYSSALILRLRTCRDEIYGVLNHYVMKNIHCGRTATWRPTLAASGEAKTAVVEATYNALMRLCEMPGSPKLPAVSDATYRASCTKIEEPVFDFAALQKRLGIGN